MDCVHDGIMSRGVILTSNSILLSVESLAPKTTGSVYERRINGMFGYYVHGLWVWVLSIVTRTLLTTIHRGNVTCSWMGVGSVYMGEST